MKKLIQTIALLSVMTSTMVLGKPLLPDDQMAKLRAGDVNMLKNRVNPLLSEQQVAELQTVDAEVYLGDMNAMKNTKREITPEERHPRRSPFHRRLSVADSQKLLLLLAQSQALPGKPGSPQCKYAPAYRLDFLDTRDSIETTVFVSFECNAFAFFSGGSKLTATSRGVFSYGTLQPERAAVLELIGHYFNDKPAK
ncbi:MAG: hypothetical protein LH481_17810 [Burkholderiales bacterium]|nr:hypothetical protein [Burkholderiales bacterium]